MLLRNKRTGFEYAWHAALANDPEFEEFAKPVKVVAQKRDDTPVVVIKKRKGVARDHVQSVNK